MSPAAHAQDAPVDFNADVRPILSNTCFHCHGPDQNTREADLRLDQQHPLFEDRGGHVAVKPGDAANSELIRRILSNDPDEVMPPPDSSKTLTAAQRDTLVRWVNQGATWQQHWSFVKPIRETPPDVGNDAWTRNEIDRFVLHKIRAAGLEPSSPAAPHILLRRIYLDLIGLQPTPAETDAWLTKIWGSTRFDSADGSTPPLKESAWQELIDHLQASPHYGERWARRWLDLARYADTNGYEKDRDRSIWPYRDWVVNAINSDLPFDQFTVEQLAGDMLPDATIDQRIATGFHRNTMLNEEGGIDPMEFRYHAMTDRVATTGTTWLGLTLGCCQCHTHKYDPVSHTEYYQIFAYLNNADEPSLLLPSESVDEQWAKNKKQADELLADLPNQWPVNDSQNVNAEIASAVADGSQTLTVADGQWIDVSGPNSETATYVVELNLPTLQFDSIKLSTRTTGKAKGPGRTRHGNFVLNEITFEVQSNNSAPSAASGPTLTALPITAATANVEQDSYEISKAIDGDLATGWGIHGSRGIPDVAEATFQLDTSALQQLKSANGLLKVTIKQTTGDKHTIGSFALSLQKNRTPDETREARQHSLAKAFDAWRRSEKANAVDWKILVPVAATSNLPILTIQDDHSIFASGDTAKRDDYVITLEAADHPISAIRLEALPDDRLPEGGPGSTYYEGTLGDFYLTEIGAKSGSTKFPFVSATHTYAKNRFGSNPATAAMAIDGDIQTGWSVHGRQGEAHTAVFVFAEPVPAGTPLTIDMSFGRHFASSLGRFRFSATDSPTPPEARMYSPDVSQLLRDADRPLSHDQHAKLLSTFLTSAEQLSAQSEKIRKLRLRPSATSSLVLQSRPPEHTRPTFRHHRGEYLQPKEPVTVGLPSVLLPANAAAPTDRLEFARWLVSSQTPLTARVVVNRHWAAFFGNGIVKTLDDFGLQGAAPSHPELLDWLAVTFSNDDQWSIRKLHRKIVSSATYRQSSGMSNAALQIDPDNRLLSSSPRIRLDAEIIRDQLLVAAGVLSTELGGPPVRPPQPGGVTESAYGSPKWTASKGSDRYRRRLYTFIKRTAPFAMFSTFDAPSGEACIANRDRSNSPLQALTMLNDVMLMELAQKAGESVVEDSTLTDTASRIDNLFRRTMVRLPNADELKLLQTFFEEQKLHFATNPKQAADFTGQKLADVKLQSGDVAQTDDINPQSTTSDSDNLLAEQAAWTATARAVFGLDESLTRE